MNYYLIETASKIAVWMGNGEPVISATGVDCPDGVRFICYNESNAHVLYAAAVANFVQGRYKQHGTGIIESPEWIEPPAGPDPLIQLKIDKNLQINNWRAAANETTFTHAGKVIACDALSRSDIDGVACNIALNGTFPAGFPGAWKAVDNSYIMLPDANAFKAMYSSMTLQGTINFGHSQALKTALAAATTAAQIDAIVW